MAGTSAEVRFLAPSGERHRAEAHRIEGDGDFEVGGLVGAEPIDRDAAGWRARRLVSYRVENRTDAPEGPTAPAPSGSPLSRPTRSLA